MDKCLPHFPEAAKKPMEIQKRQRPTMTRRTTGGGVWRGHVGVAARRHQKGEVTIGAATRVCLKVETKQQNPLMVREIQLEDALRKENIHVEAVV